jgi:hypothetical protein
MEPLTASLDQYHFDILREIAARIGVEIGQTRPRKAWLVEQLAREIPHRIKTLDVLESLGEAERAVLALLLDAGGEIAVNDLLFPLVVAGLVVPNNTRRANVSLPTLSSVLRNLLRQGLVVNLTSPPTSTRRNFSCVQEVAIAPEVQRILPKERFEFPEPRPIKSLVATPDQIVHQDADLFLRRLFFLWAEFRQQPARRLKSGDVGKRDLRRIAKNTGLSMETEAEESWLRQLCTLLERLSLLESRGKNIVSVADKVALRFWNSNVSDQLHKVLRAYRLSGQEESIDLSPISSQVYYYGYLSPRDPSVLRQEMMDLLAQLPAGPWIPFPYLMTFLNHALSGAFVFNPEAVMDLTQRFVTYRPDRQHGLQNALAKVEMQVVMSMLSQLNDFGVIDLGYAEDLIGVRLTDVAHAALTGASYTNLDTEGQVVLQPDFQVLVMGPISLGWLAALERFASREKVSASVTAYRITRQSVYPALQSGDTIGAILAFLRQITNQPVPQNVERTLEEWGERHERILIYRDVFVLQTDTSDKLDHLLEDGEIGKYLHRIDDQTAWLRSVHASKIERRLWALDLLPAVSKGPAEDLPGSLRLEQNGHLVSRHRLPSLYVEGTVRRIAQPVENKASSGAPGPDQERDYKQNGALWRLTPKSIRAAIEANMTVPDIIALLEQMTSAELPIEWEKRIKAWGNHYGEGQLEQVFLLRLENGEALRELRDTVPHLRRWLQPLSQSQNGIAIVEEEHLEEVKALLEEWGIVLSGNQGQD